MSLKVSLKHHAVATLEFVCDGCKNVFVSEALFVGGQSYEADKMAKKEARYMAIDKGWCYRSYGAKGVKHYCPNCMKKPDMVAWKMEKILLGKLKE